jgi:hypothetical protein
MSLSESRPERRGVAVAVTFILRAMVCRPTATFEDQGPPGIQSSNSSLSLLGRIAKINYCSARYFSKAGEWVIWLWYELYGDVSPLVERCGNVVVLK